MGGNKGQLKGIFNSIFCWIFLHILICFPPPASVHSLQGKLWVSYKDKTFSIAIPNMFLPNFLFSSHTPFPTNRTHSLVVQAHRVTGRKDLTPWEQNLCFGTVWFVYLRRQNCYDYWRKDVSSIQHTRELLCGLAVSRHLLLGLDLALSKRNRIQNTSWNGSDLF